MNIYYPLEICSSFAYSTKINDIFYFLARATHTRHNVQLELHHRSDMITICQITKTTAQKVRTTTLDVSKTNKKNLHQSGLHVIQSYIRPTLQIFRVWHIKWDVINQSMSCIFTVYLARGVGSMLDWCLTSVIEDGPTPAEHWAKASCLLGGSVYPKSYSREQSYSQSYSREPTDKDVLVFSWFSWRSTCLLPWRATLLYDCVLTV